MRCVQCIFTIALITDAFVFLSPMIIKMHIVHAIPYFFGTICSPGIIYVPLQVQTRSNHLKKNGKKKIKENNFSVPALSADLFQFSERVSESVSTVSQDAAAFISLSDLVCAHSICSLDPVSVSVLPPDTGSGLLSPVDHMFSEYRNKLFQLFA